MIVTLTVNINDTARSIHYDFFSVLFNYLVIRRRQAGIAGLVINLNHCKGSFPMRNLTKRFVKNEEGAALVEYGMLVGLIAVVCIVAVQLLGTQINQAFTTITAALAAAGLGG
jgi:pilus assembly protein Flp/PilA